jgi:menaquinone-specific isochorismate synthase
VTPPELAGGAVEDRSRRAVPSGVLVVTRAAAPIEPSRALDACRPGLATFWHPPAVAEAEARWAFVGGGAAARIEASGPLRLEEVRARGERLLEGLVELRAAGAEDAPPVRLLGGIAFRAAPREAPWSAFADASFTMPRRLYATDGVRAFVRVAAPAGARAESLLAEADALAAAITRAERAERRPDAADRAAPPDAPRDTTADAAFRALCAELVSRISAGELAKAALSLRCRVALPRPADVGAVLERLGAAYPECTRFAFEREGRTFVGASPERLVGVRGRGVEADALAGSIARRSPGDDASQVAALLASRKDAAEHALVVDALRDALAPLCDALDVPHAPGARSLRNVHHLHTPIRGELRRGVHVLDLVAALHPTPAVGGVPRSAALEWLAAHEPHDRGWYAGAVGWFDAAGDGAFSVGIRAGLLGPDHADLYAGAGIVEGSDPDLELAEVHVKLRPMLAALGLAP